MPERASDIIILGAGIGGLTLGLTLHAAGIPCRIYESTSEIKPVGVGVNLLPHATRALAALGLEAALAERAVTTKESVFFNRFGQLIYRENAGRYAGYEWPQFSIHRGDLQRVLLDAFVARAGAERVVTGWHCTGFHQDPAGVTVEFCDPATRGPLESRRGAVAIGCEGIHSVIRKQLHPHEGEPLYSGINMWRGVTRWKPFLSGASMVRAGWLATGKMVIYPIRDAIDADGNQLVNWVAEIETPQHKKRDWTRKGELANFIGAFAEWHFDWLDVPGLITGAETILEFPMVDQDPLERWSVGRVSLLGDAAHPMVPRGSNGAGQAILDAVALAESLRMIADPVAALAAYEDRRLEATAAIVRTNRKNPPDAILREVYERTGDRPFGNIDDVISRDELASMSEGYKIIAGFDKKALKHL
jgi:2-polyprenyl-6-methoxyphenol hydroxylase-like FAD-dependent oxidoreductase